MKSEPYKNWPVSNFKNEMFEFCISSTTWTNDIGGEGNRRESPEPGGGTE